MRACAMLKSAARAVRFVTGKPKKRKQSMTDKRTREGKRMDAEQRAHTPAENAKRAALARAGRR